MAETFDSVEVEGVVVGVHITVNIKTAIPLEKHMTDTKGAPCQALWLNVSTLWRNFSSSIVDPKTMSPETQHKKFIYEMETIESLLRDQCEVVFYHVPDRALEVAFPKAKLKMHKENKTANQLYEIDQEVLAMAALARNKSINVRTEDALLSGNDLDTWIITHHASDLLSRYRFRELTLLESNTGNTLEANKWGAKLTGSREFNEKRIPFNELTLQILGDRAVDFLSHASLSSKIKKVAESSHWHGLTTMPKIRKDLHEALDEDTFSQLLNYSKTNL